MVETPRPQSPNRILADLPPKEYARLAPHLEPFEMSHSKIIYRAGQRIEHVYFPHRAMVSVVSHLSDGSSVEVGVVGMEGMTGLPTLMGVDVSPHENIVQIPNGATRLSVEALKDEFKRGGALQSLLLRYIQSLMLQMSQTAVCNRMHTIEERLARWLLMSHDRCVCEEMPFTHEFLAMMLGVRRAGVTTAALALQAEGFIRYSRGHITILDRHSLEHFTCECYGIVKADFEDVPA